MPGYTHPWCSKCGDNFPMRQKMYDDLEECGNTFYCPNGHALEISRASVVRQFRAAQRQNAYKEDRISVLEKRAESFLGVQTRHLNRLLRGACPYCGKTPNNMIKHIQERHGPKVT